MKAKAKTKTARTKTHFTPEMLMANKIRAEIMRHLTYLPPPGEMSFTELYRAIGTNPSVFVSHLDRLKADDFIVIKKAFVDKRWKTTITATGLGKRAYVAYRHFVETMASNNSGAMSGSAMEAAE